MPDISRIDTTTLRALAYELLNRQRTCELLTQNAAALDQAEQSKDALLAEVNRLRIWDRPQCDLENEQIRVAILKVAKLAESYMPRHIPTSPLHLEGALATWERVDPAAPLPNTPNAPEPLRPLGMRNYQVGQTTFVVDDAEETVLQAFRKNASRRPAWISLTYTELRRRTNLERAPRILAMMRTKYLSLKTIIDCPGKRGQGGLKVFMVQGKSR